MLPDNRLDFITNIDEAFLAEMTEIRKDFIALDKKLRNLSGYEEALKLFNDIGEKKEIIECEHDFQFIDDELSHYKCNKCKELKR